MPHPCDHPAAALAITRGLPGQLQKAKANGDLATARAIEIALARARRIVAGASAPPRNDRPPLATLSPHAHARYRLVNLQGWLQLRLAACQPWFSVRLVCQPRFVCAADCA
jgi:hypothetical protein